MIQNLETAKQRMILISSYQSNNLTEESPETWHYKQQEEDDLYQNICLHNYNKLLNISPCICFRSQRFLSSRWLEVYKV